MQTGLSFEAKNKTLQEVFFAGKKFRVPRYQRPYAWQTEEVSELWEDLLGSDEPYFLGSFIFNTEHENTEGFIDIIDGQQRLLTVTILCAVLRDYARKLKSDKADLYHRQDIAIEDRSGIHSFRIAPADSIAEFFRRNIQQENADFLNCVAKSNEERRVKQNYAFLYDKVSQELDRHPSVEAKIEVLEELRLKVAKLVVISVEIAKEEDAYEIFETTNARGLELSIADLLKNLIFRKLQSRDGSDSAKDSWTEITSNIESANTELRRFIRYFWISKYAFTPEKRVFREIKNKITDWRSLLTDLEEDSRLYGKMRVGAEQEFQDLKHGNKIYDAIFALRLMGVSQCYVLLLSILRNFDRLGTDPTRIIQLIEKFSFKYSVVCKQPTNKVEKLYSKTAIEIEQTVRAETPKQIPVKIQSIFSKLEKDLRAMDPSEQLFVASFEELMYRNSEDSRKLVKYILGKVNAFYSKTAEHRINFDEVNVEHILPQKPHKDWNLKRNQIRGYVNMLGNLTLLSKRINSKIQNASLAEKLPELEKSELAITKEIVKVLRDLSGDWNETEIFKRQKDLGQLAYKKIWAI
jgi:uncharacterized protein with ParB-like and HNH nuclease domain